MFRTPTPPGLNEKQAELCRILVRDNCSQREAAIRAGYEEKAASVVGGKVLGRELARSYVKALRAEVAEGTTASAEHVTEKIRRSAMFTPLDFVTRDEETGLRRFKHPEELSPEQRDAVKDLRVFTSLNKATGEIEQRFEYVFDDRSKNRELLARVLGMLVEKQEITHGGKVEVSGLFKFAASSPHTSETSARVKARMAGRGTGRVIEGAVTPPQRLSPPLSGA